MLSDEPVRQINLRGRPLRETVQLLRSNTGPAQVSNQQTKLAPAFADIMTRRGWLASELVNEATQNTMLFRKFAKGVAKQFPLRNSVRTLSITAKKIDGDCKDQARYVLQYI